MTWVKLDDAFYDHPKIVELDDASFRLWVCSLGYSNKHGTNGRVSKAVLKGFGSISQPLRRANKLVSVGLWEENEDSSFAIHDYHEYQPKVDKTVNISEIRSEAGKKGAAARWQNDGKPMANCQWQNDAPVPSRPVEREKGSVIEFGQLEALGFDRFGALAGGIVAKLRPFCPIASWEWDSIIKTDGSSWGYAVKVLATMRKESSKPGPSKAKDKKEWQDWKPRGREDDGLVLNVDISGYDEWGKPMKMRPQDYDLVPKGAT